MKILKFAGIAALGILCIFGLIHMDNTETVAAANTWLGIAIGSGVTFAAACIYLITSGPKRKD